METSIRPQAVSPLKGDCLHKGNVAGTHFQTPFPTKILATRKKLNPYYYRLKHGLSHGIGIARLAPFLFEKNVPKVYVICRWHALSDAISDENLGRTKKLNPYYYRLSDGL